LRKGFTEVVGAFWALEWRNYNKRV